MSSVQWLTRPPTLKSNRYGLQQPELLVPLCMCPTLSFFFPPKSQRDLIIASLRSEYYTRDTVASIPGRVFAFITVRRTTRPGTSCLRMRQSLARFWLWWAISIFSFTFVTFIFVY